MIHCASALGSSRHLSPLCLSKHHGSTPRRSRLCVPVAARAALRLRAAPAAGTAVAGYVRAIHAIPSCRVVTWLPRHPLSRGPHRGRDDAGIARGAQRLAAALSTALHRSPPRPQRVMPSSAIRCASASSCSAVRLSMRPEARPRSSSQILSSRSRSGPSGVSLSSALRR